MGRAHHPTLAPSRRGAVKAAALPCLAVLILAAGCEDGRVANTRARIVTQQTLVRFPPTITGQSSREELTFRNEGRSSGELVLSVDPPFVPERTRVDVPGGASRTVSITFSPTEDGSATTKLRVSVGGEVLEITLSGVGVDALDCTTNNPCRRTRFDPATRNCVETLLDGTTCEHPCLLDAMCEAGECKGTARVCNPADSCSTGLCDPLSGCVSYDATPALCPSPASSCLAPSCEAGKGCGETPVADGVPCGPATCSEAFRCQAGQCKSVQLSAGAACPQPPLCTTDQWCWENPLPQGSRLVAIAGPADDNLWAVGDSGTVLRWNGQQWSRLNSGTSENLRAVSVSTGGPWIVGENGTVLRWSNNALARVDPPAAIHLDAVFAASQSVVWVGGADGRIWRWTGSEWALDRAAGAGLQQPLLWGPNEDELWAVGRHESARGIHRRNAAGVWSIAWTDPQAYFQGLAGHGPGEVSFLGMRWDGRSHRQFALTYGEEKFRELPAPPLPTAAGAFLFGGAPDRLWTNGRFGQLRHFDGNTWRSEGTGQEQGLLAAWGPTRASMWAVGDGGALVRVQNDLWRPLSSRADSRPALLRGIWGGEGQLWAVGSRATILRSDGARWWRVRSPSDSEAALNAVWGSGSNNLWIVGDGGRVLRWNGQGLSQVTPSPTNKRLLAVWGAGNEAWIGGEGALHRWNGTQWSSHGDGLSGAIVDIAGRSVNDVWFAGPTLQRWNGSSVSPVPTPGDRAPRALAVSGDELFAAFQRVDGRWEVHRRSGTEWATLGELPRPRATAGAIRKLRVEGGVLWAVGEDGVFQFNGSAWTHQRSSNGLHAMWTEGANSWVVGDAGSILRKR